MSIFHYQKGLGGLFPYAMHGHVFPTTEELREGSLPVTPLFAEYKRKFDRPDGWEIMRKERVSKLHEQTGAK
jgi:hypothetical protein